MDSDSDGLGSNESAVLVLGARLDELGLVDEQVSALLALARSTGAAIDRVEASGDRNEAQIAALARVQLDILAALALPVSATDPFEELTRALSAAVRNEPAS